MAVTQKLKTDAVLALGVSEKLAAAFRYMKIALMRRLADNNELNSNL